MSRCYHMDFCRWQKVNMHGKQQIPLYSHMKVSPVFIIREVLKKERGRDPDCVPDVVSLCLSDHSSAWIFPFSLQMQPGPKYKYIAYSKGSQIVFISGCCFYNNYYY